MTRRLKKFCICSCGRAFRPVVYLGRKRVRLDNRTKCFTCSPYLPKENMVYTKNTPDGKRQCLKCSLFKDLSEFSITQKRTGLLNSYCKECSAKKRKSLRQKFKEECITYKGGKCILCGYNKCPAALEFHHRNPLEKEFSIRDVHTSILSDEIKQELDKCDLVCSNCHKEIHYGELKDEY